VRTGIKVLQHLLYGVLVIAVKQTIRLLCRSRSPGNWSGTADDRKAVGFVMPGRWGIG